MQKHFGVRLRAETISLRLQFGSQGPVVINLTVEGDDQHSIAALHRLCALFGEIDDGETPVAEDHSALFRLPLPSAICLRAAMKSRMLSISPRFTQAPHHHTRKLRQCRTFCSLILRLHRAGRRPQLYLTHLHDETSPCVGVSHASSKAVQDHSCFTCRFGTMRSYSYRRPLQRCPRFPGFLFCDEGSNSHMQWRTGRRE
jgi:hypothetical protein